MNCACGGGRDGGGIAERRRHCRAAAAEPSASLRVFPYLQVQMRKSNEAGGSRLCGVFGKENACVAAAAAAVAT